VTQIPPDPKEPLLPGQPVADSGPWTAAALAPAAATDAGPASVEREDQSSIDHRRERIRVETAKHRIEGYVTLARDGFRSRVSDMLNASERDFLTLTEATVAPLDGGPTESHRFLAVARSHIVFAVLADSAEPPR
jgi:hypothetical protein